MLATATLESTAGGNLIGVALFTEGFEDGMTWGISIENGPPNSQRALHIHVVGNCGNGALAAGADFNAEEAGEGGAASGDLGNVVFDDAGEGKLPAHSTQRLSLRDGPLSIVGRALVLHVNPDDAAADAGVPIACGVIKRLQ